MQFHHHPDGIMYIRDGAGGTLYAERSEDFADDLAAAGLPAYDGLPVGAYERVYKNDPAPRHLIRFEHGFDDAQAPWSFGDAVLARVAELVAARDTRLAPPPLTLDEQKARAKADLYAERERRLALGFNYDFGDARGVHRIGTTPRDLAGWDQVEKLVAAMYRAGLTNQTIEILTDTGRVTVTPAEWTQIMLAAGAVMQPIWQASFDIEARIDAGEILTAEQIATAPEWPAT